MQQAWTPLNRIQTAAIRHRNTSAIVSFLPLRQSSTCHQIYDVGGNSRTVRATLKRPFKSVAHELAIDWYFGNALGRMKLDLMCLPLHTFCCFTVMKYLTPSYVCAYFLPSAPLPFCLSWHSKTVGISYCSWSRIIHRRFSASLLAHILASSYDFPVVAAGYCGLYYSV